ncbi:hypothetical protein EV356DRAFT_312694 [Viridothelium virens]|uniref:Uncharacterized protein n=1 Tax=Viridothelium virens TaxID=1048519 RepID=A0A6A6GZT8_VIRVR|nr:hypothetical protein EV356DRAFT_312694 [Viridothelium virens]
MHWRCRASRDYSKPIFCRSRFQNTLSYSTVLIKHGIRGGGISQPICAEIFQYHWVIVWFPIVIGVQPAVGWVAWSYKYLNLEEHRETSAYIYHLLADRRLSRTVPRSRRSWGMSEFHQQGAYLAGRRGDRKLD